MNRAGNSLISWQGIKELSSQTKKRNLSMEIPLLWQWLTKSPSYSLLDSITLLQWSLTSKKISA